MSGANPEPVQHRLPPQFRALHPIVVVVLGLLLLTAASSAAARQAGDPGAQGSTSAPAAKPQPTPASPKASATAGASASGSSAPVAPSASAGAEGEPSAEDRPQRRAKPKPPRNPTERPPESEIWFSPAPEISVITLGPGDAAFLKFGHNAVRVKYPKGGPDLAYNFGTFRFDNPYLILDFLTGKFKYWLSVVTYHGMVEHYRQENRDVSVQQLNLGSVHAWDIADKLALNARPENRFYVYDYYRDNCSTRIRDLIDEVLEGRLQERTKTAGSMTLREHTLRLVADDFWLYLGLDIAMGPYIDQPETRWSEMFLPSKLESGLSSVVFSGPHGASKLVQDTEEVYRARGRAPLRRKPPERTLAFLQGGSFIGGLFAFLGWEAYRRRREWARIGLCVLLFLFGLVTGVLGLLFCGLWFLTNHEVTYNNENVLQCAPWAIAMCVFAWGVYRARLPAVNRAYLVAQSGLVASGIGFIAKVLPFMEQDNHRIIALFLPIWIGVFTSIHFIRLRTLRMLMLPINQPQTQAAQVDQDDEPPPKDSKRPPPPGSGGKQDEDEEDEDVATPSGHPAPA